MTQEIYNDIKVDSSRDSLFDEIGKIRMKESYMKDDETSPQQRVAVVSKTFSSNKEHAQRLYDYASKHWLSYSTPILSFGRSKKGLPISCFLNYIEDTAEGLVKNLSETIEQELAAKKFLEENYNYTFIGKTNKKNLVFEHNGEQIRVTPKGEVL